MSAPHHLPATQSAAGEIAHQLAAGYTALTCAEVEAEHLVALDADYRGFTGWDLQFALLDARTAVENAVCVHGLAKYHPLWKHPRDIAEAGHARATLSRSAATTATRLVTDLTVAFCALNLAASHAEALTATRRLDYRHHAGYIGGLGWDLETAVDDATIAIRDAMRVHDLADINPTFWKAQL